MISAAGALLWNSSAERVQTLEYVPPIREQIAALPAEEVLVRGSDQPATRNAELLRSTYYGAAAAEEELLRADATENQEVQQTIGGLQS